MSNSVVQHRADSPTAVRCVVVTVSDTRTPATDTGGDLLANLLIQAGHSVMAREIIPDEPNQLQAVLHQYTQDPDVDACLFTGGTGISRRDRTCETIGNALEVPLPGYGELLRYLSYQEIGAAAMLSRALAGLIGRKVILTMPGSPAAIRLAMEKLIGPELSHLVREARR